MTESDQAVEKMVHSMIVEKFPNHRYLSACRVKSFYDMYVSGSHYIVQENVGLGQ